MCYTALPTHRITEHLCKITEYVENQTGKASINVLMPTIKCDSFSPTKHPNLDETDLENCIKTHIYIRAESYDYLVPVSLLTDISIVLSMIDYQIFIMNSPSMKEKPQTLAFPQRLNLTTPLIFLM